MKLFMTLGLFVLAIVGCTPTAEVLPTLIPSPQPAASATSTSIPTTAPTEIPVERPTLPPTWTPVLEASATPVPPTNTPIPAYTAIPTLVACATFDIDREKSAATFTAGQPAQVYWTPVQGAARYRIRVIDGFNNELFADYSVDPTYIFRPGSLEAGKRYAWKVYPEDSLSRQMCVALTEELASN